MRYSISLKDNNLEGFIPEQLFGDPPDERKTPTQEIDFDLTKNRFSGTLPSSMLAPVAHYTRMSIFVNENNLTKPIPLGWFQQPACQTTRQFSFRNNRLNGTLAPEMFKDATGWNTRGSLYVLLQNNALTGPLPDGMFAFSNFTRLDINIAQNPTLNSIIPPSLFKAAYTPTEDDYQLTAMPIYLAFSADNCSLHGNIPDGIFDIPWRLVSPDGIFIYSFSINYNPGVVGPLTARTFAYQPAPRNFVVTTTTQIVLTARYCSLSGHIPDNWLVNSFATSLGIYISDNMISGPLPRDNLLKVSNLTNQVYMDLSWNMLDGELPERESRIP